MLKIQLVYFIFDQNKIKINTETSFKTFKNLNYSKRYPLFSFTALYPSVFQLSHLCLFVSKEFLEKNSIQNCYQKDKKEHVLKSNF